VANAHRLNSNVFHGKTECCAKSVLDFASLFLTNESVNYGGNYATRKEIEIHKQKESKRRQKTAIDGTTKTLDWS
jgi:hypothetical protein